MTVVVDASVALKWVLPENGSGSAMALRAQSLVAPSHWVIEVANALWRYVRTSRLSSDDAMALMLQLIAAPVVSVPAQDDLSHALELAVRLGHPVYDCLYLALALREDTYVITADHRFMGACARDDGLRQRVRLLDGA